MVYSTYPAAVIQSPHSVTLTGGLRIDGSDLHLSSGTGLYTGLGEKRLKRPRFIFPTLLPLHTESKVSLSRSFKDGLVKIGNGLLHSFNWDKSCSAG